MRFVTVIISIGVLIPKVFKLLKTTCIKLSGTLPCQSLLRLALDSVLKNSQRSQQYNPKYIAWLKCHLSVINHPSITQFDDISLANHDFDRVVGPDFHNVSGTESRPDLSLQTDFNETYYSVFSQAQRQYIE